MFSKNLVNLFLLTFCAVLVHPDCSEQGDDCDDTSECCSYTGDSVLECSVNGMCQYCSQVNSYCDIQTNPCCSGLVCSENDTICQIPCSNKGEGCSKPADCCGGTGDFDSGLACSKVSNNCESCIKPYADCNPNDDLYCYGFGCDQNSKTCRSCEFIVCIVQDLLANLKKEK